jgi:hypothetical protein
LLRKFVAAIDADAAAIATYRRGTGDPAGQVWRVG